MKNLSVALLNWCLAACDNMILKEGHSGTTRSLCLIYTSTPRLV